MKKNNRVRENYRNHKIRDKHRTQIIRCNRITTSRRFTGC